jgi:hypothetical protein
MLLPSLLYLDVIAKKHLKSVIGLLSLTYNQSVIPLDAAEESFFVTAPVNNFIN